MISLVKDAFSCEMLKVYCQSITAYCDGRKGGVVVCDSVDISAAVDTEKVLMTPIIRNADQKSISSISTEVEDGNDVEAVRTSSGGNNVVNEENSVGPCCTLSAAPSPSQVDEICKAMTLECFKWTTELLGSLLQTICKVDDVDSTFERLPDCLVIDILSRLPPHSFLRCRWVCRHWRALVSSHDCFTNLHDLCRASTPMLLIRDNFAKHRPGLYVFSENKKWWKAAFEQLHLRPELMINKHWKDNVVKLSYCCQGVLLFASISWQNIYYVVNPVTQEEVTIRHTLYPGYVSALYFCPYARQFRVLYTQVRGSSCQYFVYIFKMRSWRKIRSSTSFNFLSSCGNPPVVNGALHWIVYHDLERKTITPCENGIMVFRMDKEEISAMPHPGSSTLCKSKEAHQTMTLSVKNDRLSFCNLLFPKYTVDIWILEDYEAQTWMKRYKVDLLNERIFPLSSRLREILGVRGYTKRWIKVLYVQEGELLLQLQQNDQELFFYNLDHRTVKKIEMPRKEMTLYTCKPYMKSFLAIA
ncbi:hypothetical protein CQW23_27729 [Capsicum baccatum]|uniref:F-box domain-containing protein n=1 Tax=Capsicum baccatum TaxID=33114 RepID=A0A2G2VEH2_CAPBA|nr:hypothetical protein CQW23_27729 [Capsicum baccatum]